MNFLRDFLNNNLNLNWAGFFYGVLSVIIYGTLLFFVKKLIAFGLKRFATRRHRRQNLNVVHITRLIDNMTNVLFWLFFVVIILDATGLDKVFNTLLATAGISSIVIVLAAQTAFKDIIAGISLILENKINVGDYADIDGVTGLITNLGLKSTQIKLEGDEIVIIPNGNIAKIVNYSRNDVNLVIETDVSITNDLDLVKRLILIATQKFKDEFSNSVRNYYIAGVSSQTNEYITYKLICGINWHGYKNLEYKLREYIITELKQNNIVF
ncbi:MAG: mechanosensitive ion channel domain-containing protein [Clostridia bacterium]|jgi:small-conductance mechanosensitive channel|nr:mechanosensitive ion channel family protein [Clostridia bacterium]MDD4275869.1 mechanosensitive ion channel [Clostridia bacterium]